MAKNLTASRGAWVLSLLLVHCASTQGSGAQPSANPVPQVATGSGEPSTLKEGAPAASAEQPQVTPAPSAQPGWLGVDLKAVPADQAGVQIAAVYAQSPAQRAALLVNDVVLQVQGVPVNSPADLYGQLRSRSAGEHLAFVVRRASEQRLFEVVLAVKPNAEGLLRLRYLNQPAPEITSGHVALGSAPASLTAQRGRVVVLEFWASWCEACHVLLPVLNDWYDRLSAQGVTVIGVTTDPLTQAAQSAQQLGMKYNVIADADAQITRDYHALLLPTVFVIDKQGRVRDVVVGFQRARMEQLGQFVQRLISEKD
ncbi:MAG TPA: redoxin domain-containing protein [Polyangiaceae bacterium]|nr:redoxin domain-containing protein [Polyangiaceae bacterium]